MKKTNTIPQEWLRWNDAFLEAAVGGRHGPDGMELNQRDYNFCFDELLEKL